jgi:hypothetical protein
VIPVRNLTPWTLRGLKGLDGVIQGVDFLFLVVIYLYDKEIKGSDQGVASELSSPIVAPSFLPGLLPVALLCLHLPA